MTETCDSCGATGGELVDVHRVYVVPDTWDQAGSATTDPATERWCFPCRASYPHHPAEHAGPDASGHRRGGEGTHEHRG